MIYDVEILNMVKFNKDGVDKVRIAYRMLSNTTISNTEKFKGYADLSIYTDSTKPFELPVEYFGKHLKFLLKEEVNPNDPTKKKIKLSKILNENDKDLCVVE